MTANNKKIKLSIKSVIRCPYCGDITDGGFIHMLHSTIGCVAARRYN